MSCGWWWKDLEDGTKQIEEQVSRPINMNWYVTAKNISVPGKGYQRKWGKSGKRSQGRQDWCRHMNVVAREKIRKASEVMGYPDVLKIGEWHCMRHIWARWLLFRGKFVFFYITITFPFYLNILFVMCIHLNTSDQLHTFYICISSHNYSHMKMQSEPRTP